jgi:hypothetical protein
VLPFLQALIEPLHLLGLKSLRQEHAESMHDRVMATSMIPHAISSIEVT